MLACFTRRIIAAVLDLLLLSFWLWLVVTYLAPCPILMPIPRRIISDFIVCFSPAIQTWEYGVIAISVGVLGYLSAKLAKCKVPIQEPSLLEHKLRMMRNF